MGWGRRQIRNRSGGRIRGGEGGGGGVTTKVRLTSRIYGDNEVRDRGRAYMDMGTMSNFNPCRPNETGRGGVVGIVRWFSYKPCN